MNNNETLCPVCWFQDNNKPFPSTCGACGQYVRIRRCPDHILPDADVLTDRSQRLDRRLEGFGEVKE